jgi:hypothetical protein
MTGIKLYPEMIKRKLDLLLKGEISSENMIYWARFFERYDNRYFKIFDLEYTACILLIERILFLLQYNDNCDTRKNLEHMQMVLGGFCDDNYLVTMVFPENVEFLREHLVLVGKIKPIIPKLFTGELLNEEDSMVLHSLESCAMPKTTLLPDLIFTQIVTIFIQWYSIEENRIVHFSNKYANSEEGIGPERINMKVRERNTNSAVLEKLRKLVDCYLGTERFLIIVSFVSGKPYVNFS